MTTALDIITAALGHLGVLDPSESIDASNAASCLSSLRSMLDAWQLDPQAVIGRSEIVYSPGSGTQWFTIGVGGNVNMTMPVSIDLVFVRSGGLDRRVRIASLDEYLSEAAKSQTGSPLYIVYERSHDIGRVYLYPAADGTSELHLWVRLDAVEGFASLEASTGLTLPSGYRNALEWCLADEVGAMFAATPDKLAKAALMAAKARRRLKRANLRMSELSMPEGVVNTNRTGSFTSVGGAGGGDGYFGSDYVQ